ncbi:MAG: pyridine nucleotide-disulfide oxidoreductase/dicluster-binding protein [Thermotaleaceae bacterium]
MNLDKLLEIGNKCIHNEPPVCAASCPIHMDVIAFMTEIEKGDFKKAYKLMENKIPFARLIGKICDHPCEHTCVRKDVGGSINISELEKAVIDLGYTSSKKNLSVPKKKGNVAVIGGGVSGIVTAVELDKKGYQITIFEKSNRLGGRLWEFEGKGLDKAIIEEELQIIEKKGMHIQCNTEVSQEDLQAHMGQFDAVYLGTSYWEKDYEIDPSTFQVSGLPLFIGGKIYYKNDSIIFSVSSGRRAALSIDRFISKTSMLASRDREGIFETLLDYKVGNVPSVERIPKKMKIYSAEEAIQEAKRCLKCQCIECIHACSHMQKFNITPDDYIRRINHNERIILGTHFANEMINACTECGLCKKVCPVDIGMKDIIHETRESMVNKGKMPVSAHDFALKDMKFSNSDHFSLVRKQPSKEQSKGLFYYPVLAFSQYVRGLYKGSGKTGYLFYPGCQLSATHTEYIGDIYKHLVGTIKENDADRDVGLYLGCCGAPADWAGRQDLMQENVLKIKQVWEEMDKPVFILACSSCIAIFEKYLPEVEVVSLWEVFEKYGLPERNILPGRRVLHVHDACATRYNGKIHNSIRNIAALLGYKIQELPYTKEKTKCCGYGGLVYYANREQAKEFVKDRTNESTEDILVYCAMCKDLFLGGGKKTYHILDLIFGVDMEAFALKKVPTLSERHENRTRLKRNLLKEIWGETRDMDLIRNYDFNLIILEDVMKTMEERYILVEDIERVIDNAKKNKERFFNPEDSNYLARLRLDNVTYWVKYEEKEKDVVVTSVYSHRMEVVEE